MPCPYCHQNAPIVFKGVFAFCSACERPRAPFSGKLLNYSGQAAKLGGSIGRVVGVVVLFAGLLLAAALILFFQFLLPATTVGYAVGLPIALVSVVVAALLVFFGGRLRRSGSETERQTRIEALYALAVNRGGTLTAADAARALQMHPASVDALLADLSKTQPEYVSLELDDEGTPFYVFSHEGTRAHPFGARYRVGTEGKVEVTDVLGVDAEARRERSSTR
jgi:hypothetical protein